MGKWKNKLAYKRAWRDNELKENRWGLGNRMITLKASSRLKWQRTAVFPGNKWRSPESIKLSQIVCLSKYHCELKRYHWCFKKKYNDFRNLERINTFIEHVNLMKSILSWRSNRYKKQDKIFEKERPHAVTLHSCLLSV